MIFRHSTINKSVAALRPIIKMEAANTSIKNFHSARLQIAIIAASFVIMTWAWGAQSHINKDELKVPPYSLPEVLVNSDGTRVQAASDWMGRRRKEILGMYRNEVFGSVPFSGSEELVIETTEENREALAGTANRKQIDIRVSRDPRAPVLHLLLYTPAKVSTPAPTFLCLSFGGIWAAINDPEVRLHEVWDSKTRTKVMPNVDAKRGYSKEWDIPFVLSRGYGIAILNYADIEPDWPDGSGKHVGVRPWIGSSTLGAENLEDCGAIGVWAWGLSRALDGLERDPQVDSKRVIAFGQSRLGKTVLWAGAQDERFAMVVASCSGEGGAALSRRDFGENLDNMTTTYAYQFCRRFKRFYKAWDDLPLDAHMLLSLLAPRPVLLNTGSEDLWSDPKGEFLAAQAASPVYELFDLKGLSNISYPPPDTPLFSNLGYHQHAGGHRVLPGDWRVFVDFADLMLRP